MACGSNQFIPTNFKADYNLRNSTSVFTSDQVLKHDGFAELLEKIKSKNGKCKIGILGGSHSAFSVIQMLTKGPAKINIFDEYQRRITVKYKNAHVSPTKSKELRSRVLNTVIPNNEKIKICSNCVSCIYGLAHCPTKKCMCGNDCICLSQPSIRLSSGM